MMVEKEDKNLEPLAQALGDASRLTAVGVQALVDHNECNRYKAALTEILAICQRWGAHTDPAAFEEMAAIELTAEEGLGTNA
jgi:hypothetical protein